MTSTSSVFSAGLQKCGCHGDGSIACYMKCKHFSNCADVNWGVGVRVRECVGEEVGVRECVREGVGVRECVREGVRQRGSEAGWE